MTIATLKLNPVKPETKTQRTEMTDVKNGMIIAFYYCFGCIQTVAGLIACPWSTVKSFLVRTILWLGNQENLPCSGRPTSLGRQQRRMVVTAAKSHRTMNRADFHDKFAPGISLPCLAAGKYQKVSAKKDHYSNPTMLKSDLPDLWHVNSGK